MQETIARQDSEAADAQLLHELHITSLEDQLDSCQRKLKALHPSRPEPTLIERGRGFDERCQQRNTIKMLTRRLEQAVEMLRRAREQRDEFRKLILQPGTAMREMRAERSMLNGKIVGLENQVEVLKDEVTRLRALKDVVVPPVIPVLSGPRRSPRLNGGTMSVRFGPYTGRGKSDRL